MTAISDSRPDAVFSIETYWQPDRLNTRMSASLDREAVEAPELIEQSRLMRVDSARYPTCVPHFETLLEGWETRGSLHQGSKRP